MILQDKLPEYVGAVMERRLDRSGFAVHDIVTILVVVERLISSGTSGISSSRTPTT